MANRAVTNAPFLTDLDSRAAVKGSRDPLGLQSIWTRFGRHVVGNLTTVSSSVRDFTTLLLGYYFVDRLIDAGSKESELAIFLRWEQLAAYARAAVNGDGSFRGTERVHRRLAEGGRVTLSAERAHQILGNQKIYGLWGLYTVPARSSGLVAADKPGLTPAAAQFVEETYLPILSGAGARDSVIMNVLREPLVRVNTQGRDRRLLEAVARVLGPRFLAQEREVYREHLLYGGPHDRTGGVQRRLAGLLKPTLSIRAFQLSPTAVAQLTRAARTESSELAHRLERIRVCESVLAPASLLFSFLLAQEGKALPALAQAVRQQWGARVATVDVEAVRALEGELRAAGADDAAGRRWVHAAETLAQGDYGTLTQLLLEQNGVVMQQRNGGAPWAEARNGRLYVRFRDERGTLPARSELPTLWRFPYFLDSLRAVAGALRN